MKLLTDIYGIIVIKLTYTMCVCLRIDLLTFIDY